MSVRRLLSILSVCVVASATLAAAAPKAPAPKKGAPKGPVAPAKDSGSGSATPTPAGSGSGSAEPPAPPPEEPPKDMNGVDENPDRPKTVGNDDQAVVAPPPMLRPSGYPIEEALRPITLPQNMSEIALDPHAQVSPFEGTTALRARYGITRQVQLGLTYVLAGIYNDPLTVDHKLGIHAGKAVGLDVTVLIDNWIGVKVGVPVYIDPVAVSLQIGVPLKFTFGDKFALGGLDDLLNIRLNRFPPTFYQEVDNAQGAADDKSNTTQSRGDLRVSIYAIYQQKKNVALIGRLGADEGTSSNVNPLNAGTLTYFIRAGVDWTPRKWVDLGISLGFDDLARAGSFGPQGYLAFRI